MLDKKSKVFFVIFFIFISFMIFLSYLKYFVFKDYYIKMKVFCDYHVDRCFVSECAEDDTECFHNGNKRINSYKWIKKKAFSFPSCDPDLTDCSSIVCDKPDCEEIFCSEDALSEGEHCSGNGNSENIQ
jgi:hypothetical protein